MISGPPPSPPCSTDCFGVPWARSSLSFRTRITSGVSNSSASSPPSALSITLESTFALNWLARSAVLRSLAACSAVLPVGFAICPGLNLVSGDGFGFAISAPRKAQPAVAGIVAVSVPGNAKRPRRVILAGAVRLDDGSGQWNGRNVKRLWLRPVTQPAFARWRP